MAINQTGFNSQSAGERGTTGLANDELPVAPKKKKDKKDKKDQLKEMLRDA